eukprot:TRINITY_DN10134_c0_g1_i2.p2 TRINITY_DN10134_c0_g1~~TRINITY_DN10134_c0_g1_i2.p2  ORF type:complete len:126 (-),score=48.81 TRINITY_DN10134_c0_g1_i2:69-446(-)
MSEVPSKGLLDSIDSALEDCRKIEVVLEEFDASSGHKANLIQNTSALMKHIEQLWDEGDCNMEIPDEVLSAIDQGANPDIYTRDKLSRCRELELELNGKVAGLEAFHEALEELSLIHISEPTRPY